MPIGSSLGGTYADSFDFMLQTSQQNSAPPSESEAGSKPEPVISSPVKTTENAKAALSTVYDFLVPESLKPEDPAETRRKLKAFEDAKPGDKVPEMENPVLKMLAGAAEVAAMGIPVPSSKALFVGLGGLRRLFGENQTERLLNKAWDILQTTDKPLKKVLSETGISVGADQQLRYELSDAFAFAENTKLRTKRELNGTPPPVLRDVLNHPTLYKAHPDMADIPVYASPTGQGSAYREGTDELFLEQGLSKSAQLDHLLHETQHAIQAREGLARGGNKETFLPENYSQYQEYLSTKQRNRAVNEAREKYHKLAGEQEAYNTEFRKDFTPAQRREILPSDTETEKRENQLVIRKPPRK